VQSNHFLKVIVLIPNVPGGMSGLFDQLRSHDRSPSKLNFRYFAAHDDQPMVVLRFPLKLVQFTIAVIGSRFELCHINLSIRGSTLRKVIFGILCRLTRTPYIIHLHGSSYSEFFSNLSRFQEAIVCSFFKNSAKVIVLGTVWKNFVADEIGVPEANIVILPNAVFAPEMPPPRDDNALPHILFLGLLGQRKGVPELLQALASPKMKALSWTATLAGNGDVALYREKARSLGIGDRVALPGWLGPQDVQQLLETAHILALPSHAENLPLSMLEGMGYGLCPVVTPVGAVTDVIRNGENGLLVPVGDAKALANALVDVVCNPDKRLCLATQARKDFEANYDIRDYREKLEAIYLDVLAQIAK